jgi:hypothetical protein
MIQVMYRGLGNASYDLSLLESVRIRVNHENCIPDNVIMLSVEPMAS